MKGLLIKDFKLMKNQKNIFLTGAGIAVAVALLSGDSAFLISYVTIVGAMSALGTISYDEFDNGFAFLFSLPVTRKTYALEKYLFGIIFGGALCLAATAVAVAAEYLRTGGFSLPALIVGLTELPVLVFILSITIPFKLKFGPEKSRLALFASAGLIFIVGFVILRALDNGQIDVTSALTELLRTRPGLAVGAAIAATAAMLLLSIGISIGIVNKKEF